MTNNPFDEAFNAALPAFGQVFGTLWKFNGTEYPALGGERITSEVRAMAGGKFRDGTAVLHVLASVLTQSGAAENKVVEFNREQFRIQSIERDTDTSRTLILGPAGIDVTRRG